MEHWEFRVFVIGGTEGIVGEEEEEREEKSEEREKEERGSARRFFKSLLRLLFSATIANIVL